jgi:hypothetical protein
MPNPHLAIVGSGPVGLEAALAAVDAEIPFTLYEAADTVAGNVASWSHVRLFTPWDMNVSARMRRHLGAAAPLGADCPTGGEFRERVLQPLADLPALRPHLRTGTTVAGVGREGLLKNEEIASAERARRRFRLLLRDGSGREWIENATLVLDCTGTYHHPNWLGDGGIPAPGEVENAAHIEHRIPDLLGHSQGWAGCTILLAGAGHSAQTAARDLAALARESPATRVIWALRKARNEWGTTQDDPLPERARLSAAAAAIAFGGSPAFDIRRGVSIESVARDGGQTVVTLGLGDQRKEVRVDRVLALVGGVGDHGIYRQLQVHECYATCGPMKLAAALLGAASGDCLAQTSHGAATLQNPEPGFFILGVKSYGRNSSFLLRIGYEQVGEVFGLLAASG